MRKYSFIFVIAVVFLILLGFAFFGGGKKKDTQAMQPAGFNASIPLSMDDYALNGIYLGDSLNTLIAKLGEPKIKSNNQEGMSFDYGDFTAIVNQNTVINLIATSPNISTRRGIHAGSTLSDIKAVYGESITRTDISGLELYELIFNQTNNQYVLRFAIKAGSDQIVYVGCRLAGKIESPTPTGRVRQDILSAPSPQVATKLLAGFEAEQTEYLKSLSKKFYPDSIQEKLTRELAMDIDNFDRVTDPELRGLLQETREHGCKLSTNEGNYFPLLDYEQFKQYRAYVTADMKDYIEIMAVESNEKAWEDGGLCISYQKALERALLQEQFLRKYNEPNSTAIANVQEVGRIFEEYVGSLVFGSRHIAHFSGSTKIITDKSRQFFDYVSAQDSGNSRLLKGLQSLIVVVKNNNYQQTDGVLNYQRLINDDILVKH